MLCRIIFFVGPTAQLSIQLTQCPESVSTRINRLGDLAHILHDLGVACKIMYKGGIGRVEEPLDDRPEPWSGLRTSSLATFVAGEQRLKVNALELRSPINHDEFWQTVVAMNALTQRHHTGAV